MKRKDWRHWLADLLGVSPDDRDELITLMQRLQQERRFVTRREMWMIEGVLRMREWKIRDAMIPLADAACVHVNDDYARAVAVVREWQHSRYPVFGEGDDTVLGIFLAKDLLGFTDKPATFNMRDVMRPAVFEPEGKSLDILLQDFRNSRSHMVVAVDEYALPSGIITIEDLLERIVGEIEDESDEVEERAAVRMQEGGAILVKGTMSVEEFNTTFGATLPAGSADSVAGWLAAAMGGVPRRGDEHREGGFVFKVSEADERRVYSIIVQPPTDAAEGA